MTKTDSSFHSAWSLCYTSSTARERWRASFSVTHDQMFQWVTDMHTMQASSANRNFSIEEGQNKTCNMWCWIRWRFCRPPNYRWSELQMCLLYTKCLLKPSQVHRTYANIKCKQTTNSILGAFRREYDHQNVTRRTGSRLKKICVIFVSSFAVQGTPLSMLYCQKKLK